MNKDWIFADDKYTCELRTAGVLVKDNMILVQIDKYGNEYVLPGGHIKIGETLEDGLVREMMRKWELKYNAAVYYGAKNVFGNGTASRRIRSPFIIRSRFVMNRYSCKWRVCSAKRQLRCSSWLAFC